MPDPDLTSFIAKVARQHDVDYENLDDNIKAMIEKLAIDALDCRRMAGALGKGVPSRSPRATTTEDPAWNQFKSVRGSS